MFGKVTALEGLHATGEYRDIRMQHTCSRHAAWNLTKRLPQAWPAHQPLLFATRRFIEWFQKVTPPHKIIS